MDHRSAGQSATDHQHQPADPDRALGHHHQPAAALLRDGQVHPIREGRILSTAVVFDAVEGAPLVLGKAS